MPYVTATAAMDVAIQAAVSDALAAGLEDMDCVSGWAKVARAFFENGVIPLWTSAGLDSGEDLFIETVKAAQGGAINVLSHETLAAGFMVFATMCAIPGNVAPPAPVVHAPPLAVLNLIALASLSPSSTTMPSTIVLNGVLSTWAITGTQTTPGSPPVPWQ